MTHKCFLILLTLICFSACDFNFANSTESQIDSPIDEPKEPVDPNKPIVYPEITITFHKSGTVIPIGIIWQIYNWKVFSPKVEVNVPEINIAQPQIIVK